MRGLRHSERTNKTGCARRVISPGFDQKMAVKRLAEITIFYLDGVNNINYHPLTYLAKPTGSTCNLNCDYCFYLKKESLYPGSRFRMSDEVLEAYLSQLIAAHRTDTVTVAWQGGEPTLMGLDFFRRAVASRNKHRRPGMRFENTLQTNGTLLTDDWCAFLRENNFLVGISIDGPPGFTTFIARTRPGGRPSTV
jgi:uncharacterized protein